MKRLVFYSMWLASCVGSRDGKICRENSKFKSTFFHHISVVEQYTAEQFSDSVGIVESEAFVESLNFISFYVAVDMTKIAKYSIGYASWDDFIHDKRKWLSWYEENKCKNLLLPKAKK